MVLVFATVSEESFAAVNASVEDFGIGRLRVASESSVQFHMRGLSEALEIIKGVVVLIQIDVMNFITFRDSTVVKLPNLAMKSPFATKVIIALFNSFCIDDAIKFLVNVV